jgi:hypothetical protein
MRINFLANCIVIFTPTVLHILGTWITACEQAVSMQYVPTVTSGQDGTHSLNSGHYEGRSVDFRSKDVPFELRQNLKNTAQELLGSDYLVILEETHYHIQRQRHANPPKPQETFEV